MKIKTARDGRAPRYTARAVSFLTLVLAAGVAGCDGIFQVENPNNVLQEDVERPASATALANGAHARVAIGYSTLLRVIVPASDEATWTGSYDSVGELNRGNIDDPRNDEVDIAFNNMAVARWMADEAVRNLEHFNTQGTLRNRTDLARSYLYSGIAYTLIGDSWDNFVIGSNRTVAQAPVGADNMNQVYDVAIERFTKGIAIAQAMNQPNLHTTLLAMRARSQYARALWHRMNPTVTPNALVNDEGAVADALAVLSRAERDWKYRFTFDGTTGTSTFSAYLNNRLEFTVGSPYAERSADGKRSVAITLLDPIDRVPAPELRRVVFEAQGAGLYGSHTVVSTREMHLILAEAALAAGDESGFARHINHIRGLDDLTPYSGQIPALDMLTHARRVNLFFQARRLADQYRFGQPSPDWLEGSHAVRQPGTFLPIGQTERLSNCHLFGTC